MERDPLEKYIDTNRAAFDSALPDHDLWKRIENEIENDQLEEYIEVNRTSFDQALPKHDLWSKIESELDAPTRSIESRGRVVRMKVIRYAAAAIALMAVSVFGTYQFMKPAPLVASTEMLQELDEIQTFYDFEVNRNLKKLASYSTDQNLNNSLSEIDQVIEELKIELATVPQGSEERIIQAMIDNYKFKVYILESVLEAKEQYILENESVKNEVTI